MNHKPWLRIGALFVALLFVFSCQTQDAQNNGAAAESQNLTVQQAYEFLQQHPEAILIDVRTPAEFNGPLGHVPGAHLKPVQQIEQWAKELENNKDKPILLICRSGNRSAYATQYLKSRGFPRVYNILGGMRAWNENGLPVEKESSR